jgi:hypothetical protein
MANQKHNIVKDAIVPLLLGALLAAIVFHAPPILKKYYTKPPATTVPVHINTP